MSSFEAVIFDCDGVLVDSEALGVEAELALLADCGLTYERGDFIARFVGTPDVDFVAALDADSRARLGRPLRENFFEEMSRARHAAFEGRLAEVPGAAAAVARVQVAKAVASSSRTVLLEEKLRVTGLWNLFAPHVYSTELVQRGKPAPDLFLYAAKQIDVRPPRCLVIEDSLNGVRAGVAAGMTVWGFNGGGHCGPELSSQLEAAGARRIIRSWPEFDA